MIPINPWENQNAIKTLYAKCVDEICVKHNITRMKLDILLFLANNPHFDSAKEIIEDGRAAQEKFLEVILRGFTADELEFMKQHTGRILKNIRSYLREETEDG